MSATRQERPQGKGTASALRDAVDMLSEAAFRFVAPARMNEILGHWLAHIEVPADPGQRTTLYQAATVLAAVIALCTPSPSGVTAFDRLARHRGDLSQLEHRVLTALRRSRHRLARIDRLAEDGTWRLTDLASHETITLPRGSFAPAMLGATVIALLATLDDGTVLLCSPATPLDDAALAVARGFIRPDAPRLVSSLRCAEHVYRHLLRYGTLESLELNDKPDSGPGEPSRRTEPQPLEALAEAWSELADGVEPDEAALRQVRAMAVPVQLVHVLRSVIDAREAGRTRLADSHVRIGLLMLETMTLRAAHGSGVGNPDHAAALIDELIAQRRIPASVRALFDSLRLRIRVAPVGKTPNSDVELEKLVQRIRALRAKTVAQGCTEAEALAAAEKVAELLDRHGLSLSELDLRRQRCEGIGIATDRRRRAPIDDCVPTIASFFDCRAWQEISPAGTLHYVFFGLPGDVQAADYLYDMVERAFVYETAKFQTGSFYQDCDSGQRRSATNSFQHGLAVGICGKLNTLRQAREAVLRNGSGRELVPIKEAIVEADLARLGLNLRSLNRSGPRSVLTDAYEAGQEAGQRFDYRPAIAADAA